MNIDLYKIYEVTHITGKTEFVKLIDLIERRDTNKLRHFGTFMHSGTYHKNYNDIKSGIDKNGFYIHNGYKFIGYLLTGVGLCTWPRCFYTCLGIIRDGYGRIVDPVAIMQLYNKINPLSIDKQFHIRWYHNRDRGQKRMVYGYRHHRSAFKHIKQFENSIVCDTDYDIDNDIDIPIPKIRKTSIINSYSIYEYGWDLPARSIEKSWKYQSKRKHQWKEIIEKY